ncbi:PREDICTED: digestive cysteine proteinase 1-like [Acropora digitifera]|uniref:digestive cysteine proteinase 1-like n=1 Tax=Acropora digitifera TaxID=70779 RepID=UPI00077A1187|nr:PREDICTED: digestive cysteine proteinase 1-like [Acropora digitifera]
MVKILSRFFKSSANKNRGFRKRLFLLSVALLAGIICSNLHRDEARDVAMEKRAKRHVLTVGEVLQFPDEYHTRGVLSLPYGDIVEPFEAWYSKRKQMSRIDYYNGMDRTIQRQDLGKHGFACKIVPEYSEIKQKTFTGCLHRRGSKTFPIKAQSIIPAPLYFKYSGEAELNGTDCVKWEHSFTIYDKVNTYTLYTTKKRPLKPLRYEMMGYDTLLSSYYDHYILDYHEFEAWKFSYNVFDIPTDLQCFDFSGERLEKSLGEINPMVEFMPHDAVVNTLFKSFKTRYKKSYISKREHETRKDIYRHNLRFIKSRNRQHLGYRLKTNHMADMTEEEIERVKGLLKDTNSNAANGGRRFQLPTGKNTLNLPEKVDWAKVGAVNPVRSQGICGSCYAYSVTGAMEGAYFIKTGTLLNLSEQELIDCSWGFGNRGCKGGYPHRAMQWVIKHGGLATEKSYGRYLAQEGLCHFKNTTTGAKLDFYMNITEGNTREMKQAIAFYGPVSILINTQPKSFKFYGSGIYYDQECTHELDHAALAVGYGVEKGEPYWLIKNSWSKAWGDQGYIKIAMKNNNCGVLQKAVVVKITD